MTSFGVGASVGANYTGKRAVVIWDVTKHPNGIDASTAAIMILNPNVTDTDLSSGIMLYMMSRNGAGYNSSLVNLYTDVSNAFSNSLIRYSLPTWTASPTVSPNTLDTICFSWNSVQANIEISDVAYARIA